MVLCESGSGFQRQERYIQRNEQLPDSLRKHLSTKVDEKKTSKDWEKGRRGLSFQDVETLFGKPTKNASSAYDHSTTWYHGNRYIVFDSVK